MSAPVGPGIYGWPIRVLDGTDNARILRVNADGSINTTISGTLPISGTVTVLQGTSPWLTSRNWTLSSGTDSVAATQSGTWIVQQGTPPWSVSQSGTWTTGRTWALLSGTDSVSSIQSGAWSVSISNFPTTQPVSGTVTALQGTSPWVTSRTWTLASGTDSVAAVQSGAWNITNITGTISLPTGASTEATLSTLTGKVPAGLTVTSTRLLVDGSGVTQPVSGTVTANQGGAWTVTANAGTNLNTSALALDTSVNGLLRAQGSSTSGQTGPLVQGAVTTAAPTYTTAQTSPLSLTTAGALRVDSSGSTGTVTANQGTNPWVTSRTWALASGTDSVATVQSGTWNITNISGTVSLPTGAATETTLSAINGKLNSLGQKAMANSVPVVIASDQASIPVVATIAASTKTTYGASIVGLVTAVTATDVFTITGSGTKTVKIIELGIAGSAAAAVNLSVALIKRSTANTAGTSTTPAVIPFDSTNAAGTVVVRAYTANPTLGTTVGTLKAFKPLIDSTTIQSNPIILFVQAEVSQPIVLRGTAEVLAVNFSSTTVTTPAFNMYVVWTEE